MGYLVCRRRATDFIAASAAPSSGNDVEQVDVARPHDPEVPAVESHDARDSEPLGCRDDRRVNRSEREVAVARDELGDPEPIARSNVLDDELAVSECREKSNFGGCAEVATNEVCSLRHHEDGHDERTR